MHRRKPRLPAASTDPSLPVSADAPRDAHPDPGVVPAGASRQGIEGLDELRTGSVEAVRSPVPADAAIGFAEPADKDGSALLDDG